VTSQGVNHDGVTESWFSALRPAIRRHLGRD